VTRVVVGTLGRRGADYLFNLTLVDIATGRVENRVFELEAGGGKVDPLIAAVQSTADKLLEPKVEPGGVRVTSETRGAMVYLDDAFMGSTPVRRDGLEPGLHKMRVEKEGHVGWAKDIEVPAGGLAIAYRQDIFGATREERPSSPAAKAARSRSRAHISPLGLGGLEVRW